MPFVDREGRFYLPNIGLKMPSVVFRYVTKGFTIVELMVTLTVAGVLAAIAAPSFQAFLRSNRLTTVSNDLLADLNFARAEAVKRKSGNVAGQVGQVVVCVSSNGSNCTDAPDTWTSGWIVFWDQDASGTFSTAANDVLLKIHSALPSTLTATTTPTGTRAITYNAIGESQGGKVSVLLTDPDLGKSRTVAVTGTGQGSVL
jgi:type IV fimbrial biogenesis protein FimT